MSTEKFNSWCVVELFGHTRIIGMVSEATIGGCAFIRVDVPATEKAAAYTRYLGQGAIYSMIPIGEAEANTMLSQFDSEPPFIWRYKAAERLLSSVPDDDDRPF